MKCAQNLSPHTGCPWFDSQSIMGDFPPTSVTQIPKIGHDIFPKLWKNRNISPGEEEEEEEDEEEEGRRRKRKRRRMRKRRGGKGG